MNFFLEWQEKKNSEQVTINSIMKNFDALEKGNDEIVVSDINTQMENLNNRLEKRSYLFFISKFIFLGLFNSLKKNQFDPSFLSTSFYSKELSEGVYRIYYSRNCLCLIKKHRYETCS